MRGTVLERSTFEVLRGVNLRNYPTGDWVHDPDFAPVTVSGVLQPSKYWILTRDVLSLMDRAARDAVDAAEAVVELGRARAEAKGRWDTDRALISLANVTAPLLPIPQTPAEFITAIKADIDVT